MKKYLSIITLTCTVLFVSCADQLDRTPLDQLVEETAFRTVDDLQLGLNGVIGNYNPNNIIAFNAIFTDNTTIGFFNAGQEINTLNQIMNAQINDKTFWFSHYGTLNDVNRLFANAEGIAPQLGEEDQYNNILAQAHAFRALMHYELLLYYGEDMRNDASPGVPYVDYVSATAVPARNTTGEVLVAIQGDLDSALALFPAGTNDINFATPDFVTFLRARIALESGDYPAAISFAGTIIGNYSLANPAQYLAMFRDDQDTTEVIWKYDSVQGANLGLNFIFNFTGPNAFVGVSNELVTSFGFADIRGIVNIDEVSVPEMNDYAIGKYPVNVDQLGINDFKAMRVSEAYLIRAEALARTAQFSLAQDDVFAVRSIRDAAAVAPAYPDLTVALTDILEERRLELAFEGHRYTDIKRMRSVLNTGMSFELAIDCVGAIPCELSPSSEKWIFPIPIAEINANTNMTQTTGY